MRILCIFLFLFVLIGVTFAGGGARMGGWSPISDPNSDENLIESAKFAVSVQFPGLVDYRITIREAQRQVVAGLKYDMVVEVHRSSPRPICTVEHFQVWDRFGTRTLVEKDTISMSCN